MALEGVSDRCFFGGFWMVDEEMDGWMDVVLDEHVATKLDMINHAHYIWDPDIHLSADSQRIKREKQSGNYGGQVHILIWVSNFD
jgi:hypothetical protein